MWALKKLDEISRESKPDHEIIVNTELFESALGAIHYAKLRDQNISDVLKKQNLILKSLDLETQNLWAVVTRNKRAILRGHSKTNVLYINNDKLDAKEWLETWCKNFLGREECTLAKIAWLEQDLEEKKDGSKKLIRPNEYLNEAIIGLVVAKYLCPEIPHFVKTHCAWIQKSTGFILQEFGGQNMFKHMGDLDLDEFKSCVVQVLAALAFAQSKIHFKHHDVHLDNVFINRLKDTEHLGVKLNSEMYWSYKFPMNELFVKHCGLLVKLGDFGLSSATDPESQIRFERADYELLDGSECEWGEWSGNLESQKMYDALVFLSKFFMPEEIGLCRTECSQWAQNVYKSMKVKWPEIECSNIGRPFRKHEGQEPIENIFSLDIFNEFKDVQKSVKIF